MSCAKKKKKSAQPAKTKVDDGIDSNLKTRKKLRITTFLNIIKLENKPLKCLTFDFLFYIPKHKLYNFRCYLKVAVAAVEHSDDLADMPALEPL